MYSSWMSEDHRMFQDATRRFYADEMVPNIERWCDQGAVDRGFWNQAGELGILGGAVETQYGGSGLDMGADIISTLEQSRAGDSSWGWGVHSICIHYLSGLGTEEQKTKWLPKLCSGEMVCAVGMTEPGTGSDLQAVRTTAIKDRDDYIVNGTKIFISNGQQCDLLILVVKTDPSQAAKGLSLLVLETNDLPGFTRGRNLEKMGMKGQDTSELFFENVRVPQENLLGGVEGKGFYQLMNQLVWERFMIAIGALGAMEFALAETVKYTSERKAFGQRVLDFQNTQFVLADVKTKVEVFRAFIDSCAVKLLAGELDTATASMAKLYGTERQGEVVDDCLQLFGGYGYMKEYPISRAYADARVQRIYGGTSEVMKLLIARTLEQ
ncbi:MAG: acyl-CoA dehydrogenase [Gammaproteobacteria bacterium]|jgi:acyl-CoA dehydrogenase